MCKFELHKYSGIPYGFGLIKTFSECPPQSLPDIGIERMLDVLV